MEKLLDKLNKKFDNKYNFLKIYEVTYDKRTLECVVTFLYPHEISEILAEDRKEIEKFLNETIVLNGKIKVKFKKSFLDERLISKEVLNFISENFKAGAVYLKEKQIQVENNEIFSKITIRVGNEIKKYFENSNLSNKLNAYLMEKFITNFEIDIVLDDKYEVSSEIGEVEIPVLVKKNRRYDAFIVKEIFGGNIAPAPEFIKDNDEPKSGVILAGVISGFQKKTFVKKKGKLAGQEGVYYSFNLDDGKKIECIYFSTKANVPKMDNLTDGMTVLCLGDLKQGLNGKLTYYLSKISVATIDEESKTRKPSQAQKAHKPVVFPEEFVALKQDDIFAKNIEYNDYIMQNTFVVYDLETTGIDPSVDKIVEIGAVKIENGKVTQKFACFVDPEMHIPEEASKVNNITDDMVAGSPVIDDVIYDFLDFAKGCVISGYNNINFDNKFIAKEAKRFNLDFGNENIDVYNLVRQKQVRAKNHKLTTVVEALGISLEGAHRAYNDAYATAQVLLKLNEKNS